MSPTGFRSVDIQITSCPVTFDSIYTALFNRALSNKHLSNLVIHIYFSIKI